MASGDELPAEVGEVERLLRRDELEIFAQDAHGAGTKEHLLNYSIFADLPADLKQRALALMTAKAGVARAAGALVGTAAGDAIGAVLEFQEVVDYGDSEEQPASWQCKGEDCPAIAFTGAPGWVPGTSTTCSYCGSQRPSGAPADAAACGYKAETGEYCGRITNQFRLKPGQWTDDTSMALCLADSLLCRRGFDGSDLRQRFYAWCFGAYNTAFGADPRRTFQEGMPQQPTDLEDMWFFDRGAVGCGTNMARNLEKMAETSVGVRPPPTFEAPTEDAGNAPLIRLAAVPVFFHARPTEELLAAARASSYATHPGPVAAECSAFLAFAIREALLHSSSDATLSGLLERAASDYARLLESGGAGAATSGGERDARAALLRLLRSPSEEPAPDSPEWQSPELGWRWRLKRTWWRRTLKNRGERYNGYPVSREYVGSFAMDGLAMALWAAFQSSSFDEAVERCVNLQGDADSTGAICGALCGAFYGVSAISPRIVASVQRWDGGGDIALRGVLLWYAGARYDGKRPPPLPLLESTPGQKATFLCCRGDS